MRRLLDGLDGAWLDPSRFGGELICTINSLLPEVQGTFTCVQNLPWSIRWQLGCHRYSATMRPVTQPQRPPQISASFSFVGHLWSINFGALVVLTSHFLTAETGVPNTCLVPTEPADTYPPP